MANESPAVILYNEDGTAAVTVSGVDGQQRLATTANVGDPGDLALETTANASFGKLTLLEAKDFATESTLSNLYLLSQTFATENTLAALHATASGIATENTLQDLVDKDFATENTLDSLYTTAQTLATEATLASIDATVSGLATESSLVNFRNDFNNEDFAQEETLQSIETTANGIETVLSGIYNKDFATETTLDALRTDFQNEDFAQEKTLGSVQDDLHDVLVSGVQIRNASGTKMQISSAGQARTVLYDDAYNNAMPVHSGVVVPSNTAHLLVGGKDQVGYARAVTMVEDENIDGLWRLAVDGKVSITVPPPPPGGTKVAYYADNPLEVSQAISPYLTAYVLPAGKTLYIQQIVAGCQGDPSADGSKVEVYYYNGTNHLIDRIYVVGETQFGNYPDTNTARDGTTLVGNGTTYALRIYRSRLSNSTQEIDAIVRGYVI